MLDPDGFDHFFDGNPAVVRHIQPFHIHTRMRLVTGHGGSPVVKNDQREIAVVEHGIDKSRNTGMEESGIPDKCDDFLVGGF